MAVRKFIAEVDGKRRSVILDMPYGYADDVEEAEMIVMNDEALYLDFYRGATPPEFDMPLDNPRLRKVGR